MSMDGCEQEWVGRLHKRIEELERRVAILDVRTSGMVTLGPQPDDVGPKESVTARLVEQLQKKIAEPPPPVDRSQQILTDGSPVPEDYSHTQDRGDGQQKGYVVLSAEERTKGFVRPVRREYIHVGAGGHEIDPNDVSKHGRKGNGCGTLTCMSQSIAETYARDPKFYNGTFCCGFGKHLPLNEFVWANTDEVVGS